MKSLLLTFFSLITLAGIGQSKTDISEVKEAMKKQEIAWNKADVEGFMAYYWKSDSLKFIGSKGITGITYRHININKSQKTKK